MDELTILTRQEPGIAELDNFDEIKAYLGQRLDVYRNLVYSEDSLKTAKADKAQLNKLKKALDTRRKEIKAIYMEPYLCIEAQIKELTAMIDEPLAAIDGWKCSSSPMSINSSCNCKISTLRRNPASGTSDVA